MAGNQDRFQQAMNQGHSAAWDRNWNQAIGFYRQALEEFPTNTLALTSLGLAFFELKLYDQALEYYIRAVRLAPIDPTPLEKIASIYELQEKYAEAVQVFTRSADMLLKNKEVQRAIQTWKKVIDLKPDNLLAHSRLAFVFERMGRRADAAQEHIACACLYQRSGDLNQAYQSAKHAAEIAPEDPFVKQSIELLQANKTLPLPGAESSSGSASRLVSAAPISARAGIPATATLDPVSEARKTALENLASYLFLQAESEENLSPDNQPIKRTGSLDRFNRVDQSKVQIALGQAIERQTQGDDARAAEDLERSIESGLDIPAAFFDLGLMLHRTQPTKALKYLQKSVLSPEFAMPSFLVIGQVHELNENYRQSAAAYLQALRQADIEVSPAEYSNDLAQRYEPVIESQVHPTSAEAQQELCETIRCHLMRSDWRVTLQNMRQQFLDEDGTIQPLFEAVLETGATGMVDALSQIRSLVKANKLRSAMEMAYEGLVESPFYLPLHTQIGDILLQQGYLQEALSKYMLVAEVYRLRGEASQAISLLSRVSRVAPMDIAVRSRLIELLNLQERFDEAIEQYLNLGSVYYQLGELEQARLTYADALRLAQKARTDRSWSVQILSRIAELDMQRLDLRQAIRVYEQIRTLEPENVSARSMLINLNFRMNQDSTALNELDNFILTKENNGRRQDAIQFLLSLLEENANRIELRRRLIDLYLRGQKNSKAIEQMDALADHLLTLGRREESIALIKAIIALKPDNAAEYEAALHKLESGA